MKKKFFLLILFIGIIPSVFSQNVLSLNALFNEQDAVCLPEIIGDWKVMDFNLIVSIKKAGDNFYSLQYGSKNNPSVFEAVFVNIKGEYFLDLNSNFPDTLGDEDYRNNFIKSHSIYKVNIKSDTLQLFELNYAWFYNYTVKNKHSLKYEWIENGMLLTLKTEDLQSFFESYEHSMFKDKVVLIRKSEKTNRQKGNENQTGIQSIKKIKQKCIPEFPLKEGWLGGDGDVSVAINDSLTLWLFSDSYVGKPFHTRESGGYTMVSNSAALSTCRPDGKYDIHYYWREMYSDHPQAIFNTNTKRYKFWVMDAFMHKKCLYVLLQKTGPKLGADPADIFNFSQLGFTLAKIENPLSVPPSEWTIELLPLPYLIPPSFECRTFAKDDHYIYLLVNRNQKVTQLLRLSCDSLDDWEKSMEYYDVDHLWKSGINIDDMDTIIQGVPGNTVRYHPDIKKWIMINGPGFMSNKITMRTASALTGPWSSEEKAIYQTPEQTQGSAEYNQSNFCYLGREHDQFYNKENQTMVITYDWNSTDFLQIKRNQKIYTPKVITVSLKKYGSR